MFPRARALPAFTPMFRSARIATPKPPFAQLQKRTYVDKAPVSGQPRDWTSRAPLFVLVAIAAWLPFYYISSSSKPMASGVAEKLDSRRQGNAADETRDPRDSTVKTLEQKKARDGVDHRSESKKSAEK